MEISTYNSKKINILNAIAVLLVLLIHSYYMEAFDYPLAQGIQLFTGTTGLSGVAVPLFYFMSGLLFFKNVGSVRECIGEIRKRVRSLLVPYIIWNIIFVGWYVVLHYTPGVSQFVNSDMLSHFSLSQPFSSIEYLLIEPAGFHLWFLRDLMVYIAFTPLLFGLIRRYPRFTLIALLCVFGGIARCGITYFTFGAVIAVHYGLDKFGNRLSKLVVVICGILFLLNAVMTDFAACKCIVVNPYWQQLVNFAGILALWGLYDIVFSITQQNRLTDLILSLSKYSFFIYLFHEPVFNIIKKLGVKLWGIYDFSLIILYFVNPLLMATFAVGVGWTLKKYLPRIYSILVGGR